MDADGSDAGVDEQRRKLLKLTLGSGVAFATPLMVSFSMEGLSLGGGGAVAQTYICNQSGVFEDATAQITSAGSVEVDVSVLLCKDRNLFIEISAEVEAVYDCRNPSGHFPGELGGKLVADVVTESVTITPETDSIVSVTLTLTPPALPASLRCPPPMKTVLREVNYIGITGSITGSLGSGTFTVSPEDLSMAF